MIAYKGDAPYAFFSYFHGDSREIEVIINRLKSSMCRIWYDEGLTPGEAWNEDIAEHIINCSQFVLFITPSSIESKYVQFELNYANSKNKRVLPIILKSANITVGSAFDFLISTTQFLDLSAIDFTEEGSMEVAIGKISSSLMKDVFATKKDPFLVDSGFSFFLETHDVERIDTNKTSVCDIICKDKDGNKNVLFSLKRLGAYEVIPNLSSIEKVKDYFYPGKIEGLFQINLFCMYNLEYPLYGPDVDVLIILILRIPRSGIPTVKLVGYQYVNSVSSLSLPEYNDLKNVGESGWSVGIKDYFETLLK